MTTTWWYNYVIAGSIILLGLIISIAFVTYVAKRRRESKKVSPKEQGKKEKQKIEKATLRDTFLDLAEKSLPSNVVSENGVTVSYALDSVTALVAGEEEKKQMIHQVDLKLREILRDNRNADISKHERALGIKVHCVERSIPPRVHPTGGFYG